MPVDTCIVISYYAGRPVDELVALLRQLELERLASKFEIRVIVNSDDGSRITLPTDLSSTSILIRPNIGFNIGAWNCGWEVNPSFRFYIFLQDECQIVNHNWLNRYRVLLSNNGMGVVGESLLRWPNWRNFIVQWPEAAEACNVIGHGKKIKLGESPTHLQTLALGANALCLEATNGFLVGDGKIEAIATEIMFSRHCLHHGFKIQQSAWRPFEYIRHPQWQSLRNDSKSIEWNVSRFIKNLSAS